MWCEAPKTDVNSRIKRVCSALALLAVLFIVAVSASANSEYQPPAGSRSSEPNLLSPEQPYKNSNEPNLLSPELRSQRLNVHIGKAGGSAIRAMVRKSHQKCKNLTAEAESGKSLDNKDKLVKDQVCAISKIPTRMTHMKNHLHPVQYSEYKQFLINVRDPIDRLISWWNYEIACFVKEPRFSKANETGQASDNFRRLSQECYPGDASEDGFVQMVHDGLLNPKSPEQPGELLIDPATRSCDQLARLCLRGDIMCFAHNYYNYEVYLEEIFLRKGLSADRDQRTQRKPETIRIDAFRAEYSLEDFNRTIGLWTSHTVDEWKNYPGVTPHVQSLYSRVRTTKEYRNYVFKEKTQLSNSEFLSPKARGALCKHICAELVVYKIAIRASDNMGASHVRESYEALGDHCGFDVDEVCGTTWTFRDVKAQKNIFEGAPW